MKQENDLRYFPDPDIEFRAVHYSSDEDFVIEDLEDEEEFVYKADRMTDEEVEEWAREQGWLDEEDSEYKDEEGNIYVDDIREAMRTQEDDYPTNDSYSGGRVFNWFTSLPFPIPDDIGIRIIDGASPGGSWRGVLADNYDSIKLLQEFLRENELQVNFIIDFD